MHELAVCQALVRQLEAVAAEYGDATISRVEVELGPLSGVEPELLAQAFTVARHGSCAAQAELRLTVSPLEVHCRQCGHDGPAAPNRLLCESCADWRVTVTRGDELLLKRVVLDAARTPANQMTDPQEASHV